MRERKRKVNTLRYKLKQNIAVAESGALALNCSENLLEKERSRAWQPDSFNPWPCIGKRRFGRCKRQPRLGLLLPLTGTLELPLRTVRTAVRSGSYIAYFIWGQQ